MSIFNGLIKMLNNNIKIVFLGQLGKVKSDLYLFFIKTQKLSKVNGGLGVKWVFF